MNKTIKVARIQKGFTQKQLCEKVGIGVNTLVNLEKDNFQSLKYPLMIKLAKALDTTVAELFFSEEE